METQTQQPHSHSQSQSQQHHHQSSLSDYITKNCRRLLICVVPPQEIIDEHEHEHEHEQQHYDGDHHLHHDSHSDHENEDDDFEEDEKNENVTTTTTVRKRRRSITKSWRALSSRRRASSHGNTQTQRQDHTNTQDDGLQSCGLARSNHGPRSSGDFVFMGCMQV